MGLQVRTAKMTALVNGVPQEVTILVVGDSQPSPPSGESISIEYSGKTATIKGLAGTGITFSGRAATIGG